MKESPDTLIGWRWRVIAVRLRHHVSSIAAPPEEMHQLHLFTHPAHTGFGEDEARVVRQAELSEALGFGAADVAGRGGWPGIWVLMMADQRPPVLVTGALDRGAYLIPGQGQG